MRRDSRPLLLAVGVLALSVLAGLAVAASQTGSSSATFTTVSEAAIRVRASHVHDWLRLYAQETDPGGLTDYAIRRLSDPLVPAASGQDEYIVVDLGGYRSSGATTDATRVFTLMTPDPLPDGVGEVTVTLALLPDEDTGVQPLQKADISALNGGGAKATVTMTPGQQRQVNVRVKSKNQMPLGVPYYPRVTLTVTFAGSAADYYVYEIPMAVTRTTQ